MTKLEFLNSLKNRIHSLPVDDLQKSLDYYSELIDDYIEDGVSEEEAVASLGNIEDIVSQIIADTPLPKLVKAKVKPNRTLKVWEIILIVLGSPVWLSILITAFAVVFSIYVSLWCVVVSLYSVVLSVAVATLAVFTGVIISLIKGMFLDAAVLLAGTLICMGVTILLFIGVTYTAKGMALLSKLIVKGTKRIFIGGNAK